MHFLEWKWLNFIQISLKFVPYALTDITPSLVQIMTWHWTCDTSLSEPMRVYWCIHTWPQWVNTLRPRQDGRHYPDDIFKCIFLNENVWISIEISLKFVPKGPINNIPSLVQIMAWRRPGDKPLSEPMMVRFTTHICVTRPQWVKVLHSFTIKQAMLATYNITYGPLFRYWWLTRDVTTMRK